MSSIAVVLTQGFADWECALIAGAGGPCYDLDVQFFVPEIGHVRSMGGLVATVSQDIDALNDWRPRVVAVIGGTIWDSDEAPDIGPMLTARFADGARIAGICDGTLALARAGLLNDVAHTANRPDFLKSRVKGYTGAARYRDVPHAVTDQRIITAPGNAFVTFAAAVFAAAGLAEKDMAAFRQMTAAEHVA